MNLNRRGFLRVAGGLAAALSIDRSSLGRIMATRNAPPVGLRMKKFTGCVFVTQELLDDAAFDVGGWLLKEFGKQVDVKVM
jgi:hypothetical protein